MAERTDRGYVITMAVALAFVLVCIPLAMKLDSLTDRQRAMYEDQKTLAFLQYKVIAADGSPVTVKPTSGRVVVGGGSFHPSYGVTVEAKVEGADYCVRASNEHGDTTSWLCDDGSKNPRSERK